MFARKMNGIVKWLIAYCSTIQLRPKRLEREPFKSNRGKKTELIQRILDIEWQMFSCLRAPGLSDNDHGERLYRMMRRKIHTVLPEDVLESYLQDLRLAQGEGRNLIMEKFDRREGKRPPLKTHPLIAPIVELECAWKKELDAKSPRFKPGRDEEAFRLYVTSELETYSDRTLDLYHRAVQDARSARRNLVQERYRNEASSGSASLEGRWKRSAKTS